MITRKPIAKRTHRSTAGLAVLAAGLLLAAGSNPVRAAGGEATDRVREEFDLAWARADELSATGILTVGGDEPVTVLADASDRPATPTTQPARESYRARMLREQIERRTDLTPEERARMVRERMSEYSSRLDGQPGERPPTTQPVRTSPRPRPTTPTQSPTPPTTQPAPMTLDAANLPDVPEDELKAMEERLAARTDQAETQPAEAPPGDEVGPAVVGTTPPAGHQPPVQRPTRPPFGPQGTARSEQPAPPTPQPPASPATPGEGREGTGEEYKVTDQGKLVRPEGWWKLPLEEREFFFVWKNTPLEKTLEDLAELAGMNIIGMDRGVDPKDKTTPITYESRRLQKFDDALTTYNEIVQELGYWVVRSDKYLVIRRLTEWYRNIPPERMYDTLESYRAAKLPKWEVASMVYEPKNVSPVLLATRAMDIVPDNTARATLIPDTSKIELKGFVYYIEWQLEVMIPMDEAGVPDDGRVWRAYALKYAAPSQAAEMLALLMPNASGPQAITPSVRPALIRPRTPTPQPQPQPAEPQSLGTTTAEDVDIQEDQRQNQILVKAKPAKHKQVAEYIEQFIDVPMQPTEKIKVIKLENADPAEVVEAVMPLLGQRKLYQPPAPPQKPGQPEQPAPPPRMTSIGSTAVLTPMPSSNSILVKATADEMAQIESYIALLDVKPPEEAKIQYVQLQHASANAVSMVLSSAIGQHTSSGRMSPTRQLQPFRAVPDGITDKALVISGELNDLKEAKDLITQLDVDSEAGAAEHIVQLKDATPSAVSQILQARYSESSGGGGYTSYRSRFSSYSYGGGGGGSSLPRFIPDDTSKMLIVICTDEMWEDIERLIRQVDEQSQSKQTTRTYRLQHTDAASVSSILQQSFTGRSGRSSYYYYGLGGSDDQPSFAYDPQGNILLVTATEEVHKKAADLITELDRPGLADQGEWRTIELQKADAAYVAQMIEELFSGTTGRSRSSYYYSGYYGYGSRGGGGGAPKPEVRVVAETVSNRVLISSNEEDFKKAEELAQRIDADYAAKEFVREVFDLQYASAGEVENVIEIAFGDRGSRGRYDYGSSSTGPQMGVRVQDIGNAVVVLAPKDKMEEIRALVKQIDSDKTAGNEIRTYKVKGSDYRGTYDLAQNLSQIFGVTGGSRYNPSQSAVKFIGEYGSDLLLVSAPSSRMEEIDKRVKELIQAKQGEDLTMTIRHFDIVQARPQDVADIIEPILTSRYQELQQQSGGGRSSYSYYYGSSSGPQVTVHKGANKIMVSAPQVLMPLVEELLKEFDRPATPSVTRIVALKTAKAEEIAPIVEQQMAQSSGSSGSRRSRYGSSWWGRYSYVSSSDSSAGEQELTVSPVESSNSIILRGPEEKVAEAADLVQKLDEGAKPETMFQVIKVEHADLYEVSSMIEDVVGSRTATGRGSAPVMVKADYASKQIIVSAPPEKFALIKGIVDTMEGLADLGDTELAGAGRTISRDKWSVTKLYDVKGPTKEIADALDETLYEMIGFSAPYVKPVTLTNQIIVEGQPEQFPIVEDLLAKIQAKPPKPKTLFKVWRVKEPEKVLVQLQRSAPVLTEGGIQIAPIRRSSERPNPMELIGDREVHYDDPIPTSGGTGAVGAGSPFVPPVALMADMHESLHAVTWVQATTQPAGTTQPAETAEPAIAPSLGPQAVPAPAPAPQPEAVAEREQPRLTRQQETEQQLMMALGAVEETQQAQIRYDPDEGYIIVFGREAQLQEIDTLMKFILGEMEKLEDVTKAEFRVFRVQHVAVEVAAVILEQMFNDQLSAQARQQQQRQRPEARGGQQRSGQAAGDRGEEEEGAGARRRQEEQEQAKQEAEAQAAAAAAQRIKVIPDPRTGTLIVRAAPDLFPTIAELLLKIDRPTDRPPVAIKIFQLQKLNAYDVEQAIKAILKIEDTQRLRTRPVLGRGAIGADAQAQMIEQLQAQMLEMQAAQVEAAGTGEAGAGKLKINPAKDITITSDATTNSIIVSAADEGMKLVGDLINKLEEQEIPLEIHTFTLKHGDAEKVAAELEKVFQPERRTGGRTGPGGEGVTPSRVGGDIKIASDARTNAIVVRALRPDMEKIKPLIEILDVEPDVKQVQIYPVEHGDATDMAGTLSKIFAETGEVGTARAVRIQADAGTNTVLVWAPNEAKQMIIAAKIKELDQRVGAIVTPRQITLNFASASTVASTLTGIFASKGRNRSGSQRIEITGDDNSGTLFVTAPEEVFKEIQKTAEMIDTPSKQDVRIVKLEHAAATDVETQFKTLMTQMLAGLKKSGTMPDVFGVTADPRTNSLVIVGTPTVFLLVDKVLKDLDVPPTDTTAETVATYPLRGGGAASVAASINALYAGQKFPGGVQPPRAVASGDDIVYVYGTGAQIQQVKSLVIDPMEAYRDQKPVVGSYTVAVVHAKPEEVAERITTWFSNFHTAQKAAGYAPASPAETALSVMSDAASKQLFITCSEANKTRIDGLLKTFDTPEASDAGQQVKVIPVQYANLTYAYQALSAAFVKSGRVPAAEQVTITPEYGTNSLVIKALPDDMKEIEALLAQIDREDMQRMTPPETIRVINVKASEIAANLNNMITRTFRRDSRTSTYPVTVTPNDSSNVLLVTAEQPKHMQQIKELIGQLDTRPADDGRDVKSYVLQFADPGGAVNIIMANFADNASRPVHDQINIGVDYTTSSLTVTASAENHRRVAEIVEELDKSNIATLIVPETIKVQNVKATELAAKLSEMIRASKRPDRRTSRYPVTVTGDDTTNSLLVTANAKDMEETKALIAKLDVRPDIADDRTIEPYVVEYADLSAVQRSISSRFAANASRSIREQVSVDMDYSMGALLVTASPENHAVVRDLVDKLDQGDIGGRKVTQAIQLTKARASDVATTLTATLRATAPQRRGTVAPTVQANDATNALLVTATAKEFEEIHKLVKDILDVEPSADRFLQVYPLKYAELYSVMNAINTSFRGVGPKRAADMVEAVAESGTYSVIVMATPDNHEKVAKLIENLDKPGTGTRQTYPIEIVHTDPEDLAQTLTTIYNTTMDRTRRDSRVPAVFNVLRGSRSLLVTTTETELPEIKKLITELDVADTIESRDMRVVPVARIAPTEMAQMLTEYLRKPGRTGRSDPTLMGGVNVLASAGASAVVLTGPSGRLDELVQLIEKVDAAKSEDADKTGRQTVVIPLVNADPSSVASVITQSFGKRGNVAEADQVAAAAERTTNTVVVTATAENLEKIQKMIDDLDKQSSNVPREEIIQLQHARADELADVLTQTYRSSRRGTGSAQITFAADANSNSIVVSASEVDIKGVKEMVSQLDKPATDKIQELRIVPLKYADATEAAEILSEFLRKPTGTRGRGRSSGDLIGDIRVQASATMNALVVSGTADDLDRIQALARSLDQEDLAGAGTPKTITLEHASPSQLAATLTQMFTEPARTQRGRSSAEVPLIMADDASGSLLVRARPSDFAIIEETAKKLDIEPSLSGMRLIPVSRAMDVATLARQIEDTINQGQRALQAQKPGYRAAQVKIGWDERVPALLVSGSPELFPMVEKLVGQMHELRPPSSAQRAVVIPVNNIPASDLKRILDQVIEKQTGKKQK